jgi:hypothetical protein
MLGTIVRAKGVNAFRQRGQAVELGRSGPAASRALPVRETPLRVHDRFQLTVQATAIHANLISMGGSLDAKLIVVRVRS